MNVLVTYAYWEPEVVSLMLQFLKLSLFIGIINLKMVSGWPKPFITHLDMANDENNVTSRRQFTSLTLTFFIVCSGSQCQTDDAY